MKVKPENKKTKTDKFLDDMLPIGLDYSGNHKEEGIYRISLGGVSKSATGDNWQYEPFFRRFKTEEEALDIRNEIFKSIKSWMSNEKIKYAKKKCKEQGVIVGNELATWIEDLSMFQYRL